MNPCRSVACDRAAVARGLCNTHWTAWRWASADFTPIYGDTEARFWSKVDRHGTDECWPWTGMIERSGYGQFYAPETGVRLAKAHRYAYELLVGPVPGEMDLDHLCHTRDGTCRLGNACPHRRCVNPKHLQPVTPLENWLRSRTQSAENTRKTHCVHGHLLSGANLIRRSDGGRRCRECKAASERQRYLRKIASSA